MCHGFLKHMTEQFRINILAVEYPGYGLLDQCQATEENLYIAAITAIRFLVDQVGAKYCVLRSKELLEVSA